jgi:2Fe-2S ferredoxin
MITFEMEDGAGRSKSIEVPEDINLNLMEVLRASGYPVEATCGGMALCATCYVEIREGGPALHHRTDAELDMLDTLPSANEKSRLACQIKVTPELQDARFKISSCADEG